MATDAVHPGRGPGRGQRADAVRNRARVVEAAHRMFSTSGPDVSIREVAKEAGVGLGTIYRHFPDKDALLAAVVEQRFRGLAAETRALMTTETPWNAFAAVMRRMAEMMSEDRAFGRLVGAARQAPAEALTDPEPTTIDRARTELDQALADVAAAAQAAGELRTDVGPVELGLLLAGVGLSLGPPGGPAAGCAGGPDVNDEGNDDGTADGSGGAEPPWGRYLAVALDGLRSSSRGAAGR